MKTGDRVVYQHARGPRRGDVLTIIYAGKWLGLVAGVLFDVTPDRLTFVLVESLGCP